MVGKSRSCTACRQAKTACDAKTKAPDPCSRCEATKLECCFSKNFKRVATRRIAREIANSNLRPPQYYNTENSPSPSHQSPASVSARWLLSTEVENSDFTLGSISLTSDAVFEILRHFQRHYYPYAPFLTPVQSLATFASESPLLFWTTVLIASQHHEKYNHLYKDLFHPHSQLLACILNTTIRSLGSIHALLLLCLWPIPRRRTLLDPSWTYVGMAVHGCMTLNCHNPLSKKPNAPRWVARHIDLRAQCLTWLACFGIGTRIALFCGFVPPMSSSYHLKYVRKAIEQLNSSLPLFRRASLAIDECICNYSIILENTNEETHFLLTNMFDANLDAVKQTYAANWIPDLDVHLHIAKLNLYALSALLQSAAGPVNGQTAINRQTLFLRGLDSAIILIDAMKNFVNLPEESLEESPEESQRPRLPFLPSYFFTALFFAAIFVFRLFVFSPLRPLDNIHSARAIQAMLDAQAIFQHNPNHRDHARAARLITKFLEIAQQRDPDNQPPLGEMVIVNRLGASLQWDTIAKILASAARDDSWEKLKQKLIGPEPLPPAPDMECVREGDHAPTLNSALQEQEDETWTTWDHSLDDFDFGFDSQMLWEA